MKREGVKGEEQGVYRSIGVSEKRRLDAKM